MLFRSPFTRIVMRGRSGRRRYDPATGTWRLGPPQTYHRTYHSVALMLPDGSVLSTGDEIHEQRATADAPFWIGTAEIYRPAYLYSGARPVLDNGIAVIVNDTVVTYKDVSAQLMDDIEFLERRYSAQPQV